MVSKTSEMSMAAAFFSRILKKVHEFERILVFTSETSWD
jgi:hypothetical protein